MALEKVVKVPMDWGMQNRIDKIIKPKDGKCLMLAVDHGYFQGPTSGLENLGKAVEPILEYADALMISRGALKNWIPPSIDKPIVLRMSAGNSMYRRDTLDEEFIMTNIEDAIRINASAITCSVFIGFENQKNTLDNLAYLVNEGNKYGIPVLAVTALGGNLTQYAEGKEVAPKDDNSTPGKHVRYLALASRICVELGAHMVKTYHCDGFEKIVEACGNVPVVIAGGKKIPEKDALEMAYKAISQGASGVDMGRNIFQSDSPVGMIKATREIVHNGADVKKAYEIYTSEKK